MDLKQFATMEKPIRCSGIGSLIRCPWKHVMVFMAESVDSESGEAADTGSAMHKAIALFHKEKASVADAVEGMRASLAEYPLADLADATGMFLTYATDPRNVGADVVLCEEKVQFTVAAHPFDPTGEAIAVEGTVDQVRMEDGKLRVWDPKSSKKDPYTLLQAHQWQLAGYCVGATMRLKEVVHPGGLILTRMYERAKNPFWPVVWDFGAIEHILMPLRITVAMIRAGHVWHYPNSDCIWCHQKSPDICLPALRRALPVLT